MTLGKFSRLLKWFGPVKQGEVNILQRMEEVMKQKWFFGTIGAEDSENVLKNGTTEGMFLVRLNTGKGTPIESSPYTISRVEKGSFVHTRVYPSKTGGLYIKVDGQTTKVPGVLEDFVVGVCSKHPEMCGKIAPNHPFEALFAAKPRKAGAYQATVDDEEED